MFSTRLILVLITIALLVYLLTAFNDTSDKKYQDQNCGKKTENFASVSKDSGKVAQGVTTNSTNNGVNSTIPPTTGTANKSTDQPVLNTMMYNQNKGLPQALATGVSDYFNKQTNTDNSSSEISSDESSDVSSEASLDVSSDVPSDISSDISSDVSSDVSSSASADLSQGNTVSGNPWPKAVLPQTSQQNKNIGQLNQLHPQKPAQTPTTVNLAPIEKSTMNEDNQSNDPDICKVDDQPKCSASVCGLSNLHPILDPRFNMRESAKQCLLLEDHLNNSKKRCFDCIRKHFLIIDGLLEEAISLEKDNKTRDYYRGLYLEWVKIEKQYAKNPTDSGTMDDVSKLIRIFRKPLVEMYFDTVSEYDD